MQSRRNIDLEQSKSFLVTLAKICAQLATSKHLLEALGRRASNVLMFFCFILQCFNKCNQGLLEQALI